jgi:hypothetical protein
VHFVDDINLEATATGADVNVAPQLPNLFNPAVTGSVKFQHIDVITAGDR